ncbi:GNAT family N-acetyltransferase [Brevundimonas lenta]|uniref:Ribosomal protein S18 acetylase RimI-like enzyme n=1 Tax=Brevundimonas lenta TaxID=424796 RepID=A0A7W6NR12_9CAUL|nr:GNAT family N-acetyltransferase [Brevundimonas lenta]MBB4084214.1 ribosomal protein S18 acetylase RimI-like enzyme [Brevundimonas lenta]
MTDLARPYRDTDREDCLRLFDSNSPTYFDQTERPDYEAFLDDGWPYQVIERDGRVVACGGHAIEPDGSASLCWGMVDGSLHRQGVGDALTRARIVAARAAGAKAIRLDTSQLTTGFYERYGFVVQSVIPNGYAPGKDRCEMRLEL